MYHSKMGSNHKAYRKIVRSRSSRVRRLVATIKNILCEQKKLSGKARIQFLRSCSSHRVIPWSPSKTRRRRNDVCKPRHYRHGGSKASVSIFEYPPAWIITCLGWYRKSTLGSVSFKSFRSCVRKKKV